jgi:hypothetical protein
MPAEQVDAMVAARDRAGAGGSITSLKALAAALADPQRPLSISVRQGDAVFTLQGARRKEGST